MVVAEARHYFGEALREDIAGDEKEKRNSTVVKKPLAKFRVPVNVPLLYAMFFQLCSPPLLESLASESNSFKLEQISSV
jgi:hypothetical protein